MPRSGWHAQLRQEGTELPLSLFRRSISVCRGDTDGDHPSSGFPSRYAANMGEKERPAFLLRRDVESHAPEKFRTDRFALIAEECGDRVSVADELWSHGNQRQKQDTRPGTTPSNPFKPLAAAKVAAASGVSSFSVARRMEILDH